ncbi:hypothetical protein P9112_006808 [Eukaryota sp. TZLM1-RC]
MLPHFSFYQEQQYKRIFEQFLTEHHSRLTAQDLHNLLPLFGPARSLEQCESYISQYSTLKHTPPSFEFDDFICFLSDYQDIIDKELENVRRAFDEFSRRYGRGIGKEAFQRILKSGRFNIPQFIGDSIIKNYFKHGSETLSSNQFVEIVRSNTSWVVDDLSNIAIEGSLNRRVSISVLSLTSLPTVPWPFPLRLDLSSGLAFLSFCLCGNSCDGPVVLNHWQPTSWQFKTSLNFDLPAKLRTAQQWVAAQQLIVEVRRFLPLSQSELIDSNPQSTETGHSECIAYCKIPLSFILLDCSHQPKSLNLELNPHGAKFQSSPPTIKLTLSCNEDGVVIRRQLLENYALRRFKDKLQNDLNVNVMNTNHKFQSNLGTLLATFNDGQKSKFARDRDKHLLNENIKNFSSILINSHSGKIPNFSQDLKNFSADTANHPEAVFTNNTYPSTFYGYYSSFLKEVRRFASRRVFCICAPCEYNVFRPIWSFLFPLQTHNFYRANEQFNQTTAAELISLIPSSQSTCLSSNSEILPGERPPIPEQICSPSTIIHRLWATQLEKAILLACLFIGLGVDAFVACGTDKFNGFAYWVVTFEKVKKRDGDLSEGQNVEDFSESQSINFDDSSTSRKEAVTVHHWCLHRSTPFIDTKSNNFPYKTVGCMFNSSNVWLNVQKFNRLDIEKVNFNITLNDKWLPFLTARSKTLFSFAKVYEAPASLTIPPTGYSAEISEELNELLLNKIKVYREKTLDMKTLIYRPLSKHFITLSRDVLSLQRFKTGYPGDNKLRMFNTKFHSSNPLHFQHTPPHSILRTTSLLCSSTSVNSIFKEICHTGILDCKQDPLFGLGVNVEYIIGNVPLVSVVVGYIITDVFKFVSCAPPLDNKPSGEINYGDSLSLSMRSQV